MSAEDDERRDDSEVDSVDDDVCALASAILDGAPVDWDQAAVGRGADCIEELRALAANGGGREPCVARRWNGPFLFPRYPAVGALGL